MEKRKINYDDYDLDEEYYWEYGEVIEEEERQNPDGYIADNYSEEEEERYIVWERDDNFEEKKRHAALYLCANKKLLEDEIYHKTYIKLLDEYARMYAYWIRESTVIVTEKQRSDEDWILQTEISACGRKAIEKFKEDALEIVGMVAEGKSLLVNK